MNEGFRRLAEERPRAYGALLLALAALLVAFMRGYAALAERVSLVLVLLVPYLVVFGAHALVLGTTPSSLRAERATAAAMFVLSALGSVVLWRWIAG